MYFATGITEEQEKILLGVSPEELKSLPTEQRLSLVLQKRQVEATESAAFWDSVSSVLTVVIPFAAALGLTAWLFDKKGKKK